jgi:MFS transporter, DHA3 family, macrolide efflux protein
MKTLSVYQGVFTQKQYLKLILANIINRFGDSVDAIAFSWMAYQITGSASWMAIVFAFNALPSVFLMPFAGAWVERFDKKKVMMIADFGRGILVAITAYLYWINVLNPYLLILFTVLMSTFEAFRIPSGLAIVPKVLDKEHYTSGMSLNSSMSQVSMLIGMALAGAIVAIFGVAGAMLVDAVTFILSAMIIGWINVEHIRSEERKKSTLFLIKEGFDYLRTVKVIFVLCLFGVLMNMLFTPIGILQTPYIVDILKLEAYALSVMGVGSIVGMAFGSFIFPMLTQKWRRHQIMSLGGFGIGLVYIAFTFVNGDWPKIWVYTMIGLLSVLIGINSGFLSTSVSVSFMHHVNKDYIARAGSIFNAMVSASVPLASLMLSGLALVFPILTIMTVYGVFAMTLFVFIYLTPSLKEL